MSNKPWLPYLTTEFIKSIKPQRVFEWGSGESTLFFAQYVRHLVSIEHDQEWYNKIKPQLPAWVDYQYIPYELGEIGPDKSDPCHYKSGSTQLGPVNFRNYASAIDEYEFFDLILIDGMARASCISHAISHVQAGGYLVIDNTGDRPYYLDKTQELFGNYESGWEKITFMGYGPILDYKWETTVFVNKRKDDYPGL